jgi:hypothetical protein
LCHMGTEGRPCTAVWKHPSLRVRRDLHSDRSV